MTSFQIENSVAFVTGTNRPNGIGRAIVDALLQHNVKKVYATARTASQLDELVAASQGRVVAVELDVTDFDAIKQLPTKYPDVNLLVNNAGYVGKSDFDSAVAEIHINYLAPLAIVQAFAPLLKKGSAVVNINSVASFINFPGAGTYSASKAAAHSLTQAQRRGLPESLVIGIYPGPIETDLGQHFPYQRTSPADVADRFVAALQQGLEDEFPDAMGSQLYQGWKADAKSMEQQMAQPQAAVEAQ